MELERLALGSTIPSDPELADLPADRLWMLADAYALGGMPKDVLRVLRALEAVGDESDAQRGRIEALRAVAEERTQPFDWPDEVSRTWESRSPRMIRTMRTNQRVAQTHRLAGEEFRGWRLISKSNESFALGGPDGTTYRITSDVNLGEIDKQAQICGGVMVVVMPDGLIAIDLHKVLTKSASDVVMWQRSLSGDGGPVARRRSTTTPFDDQLVRYYVGSNVTSNVIPEFRLGPVVGDRVIVLQGGDLTAIDLLTSETLWRNSAAPLSGGILCDGDRVAVVSPATDEVVFFDVHDGRKLGVEPWRRGEIWTDIGSTVLSYRETDKAGQFDLLVTDPFNGEVLLQHQAMGANRTTRGESNVSSYGRVVDGRYLALLDNGGNSLIWDVVLGKEIAKGFVRAHEDLLGLNTLMLDGTMLLLPKRKIERVGLPDAPQVQTSDGRFHTTVHGVHAISMVDGTLRWEKSFEEPWGCTLTQPAETPLLLFSRSPFTYSTTSRRKKLDVLAIDVRDGRLADESLGRPIEAGNNELETQVVVHRRSSRLMVTLGTQQLTYTFGKPEETSRPDVEVVPYDVE